MYVIFFCCGLRLTVLPPSFLIRRLALNHICHLPNPLSVSNTFDKSFGVRLNIQYGYFFSLKMFCCCCLYTHTNRWHENEDVFFCYFFYTKHIKVFSLFFFGGGENDISMCFVRELYECFCNWQLLFSIDRRNSNVDVFLFGNWLSAIYDSVVIHHGLWFWCGGI